MAPTKRRPGSNVRQDLCSTTRVSPWAIVGIALPGLGSTGSIALILYLAASLEHPSFLRDLWFVCNRNVNRYKKSHPWHLWNTSRFDECKGFSRSTPLQTRRMLAKCDLCSTTRVNPWGSVNALFYRLGALALRAHMNVGSQRHGSW